MIILRVVFLGGGTLFLLAAVFLRELPYEGAKITAVTFTIIGVVWVGTMLAIMGGSAWSGRSRTKRGP